jgi:hypothetical protein
MVVVSVVGLVGVMLATLGCEMVGVVMIRGAEEGLAWPVPSMATPWTWIQKHSNAHGLHRTF